MDTQKTDTVPTGAPQSNSVSRCTKGFAWSLALSSVVNALLVVAKEKSPSMQAWMKRMTGHHWITHVAIVLIVFFVGGIIFSKLGGKESSENRLSLVTMGGVVIAAAIIVAFYLIAG